MQKILISGPESSGKSTLAQGLAQKYNCPWVPEFARTFLISLARPYRQTDLLAILLGQLDAEDAAARQAPEAPYLFCDTGPEVLYIWSKVKYGQVAPPITVALRERTYARRLLCYPDLPWEADPLREAPDPEVRQQLFTAYEQLFQQHKLAYEIVRGERASFRL